MTTSSQTSSFSRWQRTPPVELGTRPGLHGQTLLSSGLADLDKLLGGGVPLGSVMLVIEDAFSQQHLHLMRYFIAEGVACGHSISWIGAEHPPGGAAAFVPQLARASSASKPGAASTAAPGAAKLGAAATPSAAAPAAEAASSADSGLRIAWQYRKYIQQQAQAPQPMRTLPGSSFVRAGAAPGGAAGSVQAAARSGGSAGGGSRRSALEAGVAREWCHRFDLTKPLGPEALAASKLEHCVLSQAGRQRQEQQQQQQQGRQAGAAGVDDERAAEAAASGLVQQAHSTAQRWLTRFIGQDQVQELRAGPAAVGRLVLQSLGSRAWLPPLWGQGRGGQPDSALEAAMLAAVAGIRVAVQDASCAVLITCPAALHSQSFLARLQHLADVVLALEPLADDSPLFRMLPDPLSATALLQVRRLQLGGLMRQRPPDEALFVVRNKRRSIGLSRVEVDPDAGSGDTSLGAAHSTPAAQLVCGGPSSSSKAFDF